MRLALVWTLAPALASLWLAGCGFEPKVDAHGFPCTVNRDCPPSFRCVKESPAATIGICCNRKSDVECRAVAGLDGAADRPAPGDGRASEVGARVDLGAPGNEAGPSPRSDGGADAAVDAATRVGDAAVDVGLAGDAIPDAPVTVWTDAGPDGSADAPTPRLEVAGDLPSVGSDVASDAAGVSLAVVLAGSGTGKVTSSPPGIDCGDRCTASFAVGTLIRLTAEPDGTSTFAGWSLAACPGTDACTVTADAAKTVTARFDKILYELTVGRTGPGTGQVSSDPSGIDCGAVCKASFAAGTMVTLTPLADGTSIFSGWSGACSGKDPCAFVMDGNKSATVQFDAAENGVNVSKTGAGQGTIRSIPAGIDCGATCKYTFAVGTSVTLSATADELSVFTGWSGACSGPGDCALTAGGAQSVTASFAKALGTACGVSGECQTGMTCLDGVCCGQSSCPRCQNCGAGGVCNVAVKKAEDTTGTACSGVNTCDDAGACKSKSGEGCSVAGDCASGACTDGHCCAQSCATCYACTGAGGTCVQVIGDDDPDSCTGDRTCNAAGVCLKKAGQPCGGAGGGGGECASGNCVDAVCCSQPSCPQCRNCGTDGACSVTVASAPDTTGTTCSGGFACSAAGACVAADPCVPDPCNGHGTCAAGTCTCAFGFKGTTCSQCDTGYSGYPSCAAGPWVERWKQIGETATSYFGSEVISFGPDANGDGIGDVLVGAPGINSFTGAAYLYSGKDGTLLQSWAGESTSASFGGQVSLGPDVNGDGKADVLIGAIGFGSQTGKVYLHDGATGAFLRSWTGPSTYALFGYALSLGPDVNGDGRGDALIGMPTSPGIGQAFIYSGADGTLLRTFTGAETDGRFGSSVFLGADVSGDGRGDALVTETWATVSGMSKAGKVNLYSGASGSVLKSWVGAAAGDRFGISLSIGPDVDGDGRPDVAIGSSLAHDGATSTPGKVYLYSSSSGSLLRSWQGPYSGSGFGVGLSVGPDADGDGRGDVLIGSETKDFAALFSSATGQMLHLWNGPAGSGLGRSAWLGPSSNGDGKPEVALAAGYENSGQGAVHFYASNRGACLADCTGKCGGASDGCGGTCTAVPAGSICSQQFLIPDPCVPDPCNGHGACVLGACTCNTGFAGTTCNACTTGYENYPACSAMCSSATPIALATPGTHPYWPAVVWNGTEWGAAYRNYATAPLNIYFSRLDATGAKKAGSEIAIATAGDYPDIAWSSAYSRYGAVWAGSNVYFACLDNSGVVGAIRQVSPSGSVGSTKPRITSQGSTFAVVWDDYSSGKLQVYFARYSANTCAAEGSILKVSPVSTNTSAAPDVVYGPGEYGVPWMYQDASTLKTYLMFSRVDQNSAKVAGSDITIAEINTGAGGPYPRIDWNVTNYQYGIAFLQGEVKIAFARVSSAGAQVGSPVIYSTESAVVNGSAKLDIAAAGSRWGVTWMESSGGGAHFMRLDSTGARVSPVLNVGGYGSGLGWDGSAFLDIYPDGDIYTARITCP